MKNIKLFPTIEEVFEEPNEYYKMIFLPLLTVDLKSIGKGNGKLHFITVQGDGDPDDAFTGKHLDYNYIIFKIINDKYKFEGNLNEIPNFNNLKEWYLEAEENYQKNKEKFTADKEFVRQEKLRMSSYKFEHTFYINGMINYWVTKEKFKETGKLIQGGAYIRGDSNHDREPYEILGGDFDDEYVLFYFEEILQKLNVELRDLNFIGKLTGFNYSSLGEDEVILFHNKKDNEVIQYFDWS